MEDSKTTTMTDLWSSSLVPPMTSTTTELDLPTLIRTTLPYPGAKYADQALPSWFSPVVSLALFAVVFPYLAGVWFYGNHVRDQHEAELAATAQLRVDDIIAEATAEALEDLVAAEEGRTVSISGSSNSTFTVGSASSEEYADRRFLSDRLQLNRTENDGDLLYEDEDESDENGGIELRPIVRPLRREEEDPDAITEIL